MKLVTLKNFGLAAVAATAALSASPALAAYYDTDSLPNGEVGAFAGGKFLNSSDWSPAETQYEFGAEAYYKPKPLPFGFTAGYGYSRGNGNVTVVGINDAGFLVAQSFAVGLSTQEFRFGLKKVWPTPRDGQVYVEGGGIYGSAKLSFDGASNSDQGLGGWIGGGVMYPIAYHWALGPRVEYSYYKTTIDDDTANAGGFHIGLQLAYQW